MKFWFQLSKLERSIGCAVRHIEILYSGSDDFRKAKWLESIFSDVCTEYHETCVQTVEKRKERYAALEKFVGDMEALLGELRQRGYNDLGKFWDAMEDLIHRAQRGEEHSPSDDAKVEDARVFFDLGEDDEWCKKINKQYKKIALIVHPDSCLKGGETKKELAEEVFNTSKNLFLLLKKKCGETLASSEKDVTVTKEAFLRAKEFKEYALKKKQK